MSLRRSYYYRVMREDSPPRRLKLDLPLVFFSVFSRAGLGLSILAGLWWAAEPGTLPLLGFRGAVLLGAACLIVARSHANTTFGLFHVFANPSSLLAGEILCLLLWLACAALHGTALRLGWLGPWTLRGLALLVAALGALTLFLTGRIYRFAAHPFWNTQWVTFATFASALTLGAATLGAASAWHPGDGGGSDAAALAVLALLTLTLQGFGVACFVRSTADSSRRLSRPVPLRTPTCRGYLVLGFTLPALALLAAAAFAPARAPVLGLAALSLYAAVFLDRALFFQLETPAYFLSLRVRE
ncbi:MAG: dimethyl sulfoxide reductase anchor subunit [Deltaproteobacteria bacterium]|nr:dimethyl sulfoxide reductase anchor subunit [Deltaproteobacteria bacterium]